MTLKVIDHWTTQHGSWDIDPRNKYGIDQAHRDKYQAGGLIPGAGADHHIFVFAPSASTVEFSSDGNEWGIGAVKDGWWNYPMFKESYYDPDKGEKGPWRFKVDGKEIANGIGLPKGEHVSWFFIVDDVADVPDISPTPTPDNSKPVSHIQVLVDEVMVFDNWSTQ